MVCDRRRPSPRGGTLGCKSRRNPSKRWDDERSRSCSGKNLQEGMNEGTGLAMASSPPRIGRGVESLNVEFSVCSLSFVCLSLSLAVPTMAG